MQSEISGGYVVADGPGRVKQFKKNTGTFNVNEYRRFFEKLCAACCLCRNKRSGGHFLWHWLCCNTFVATDVLQGNFMGNWVGYGISLFKPFRRQMTMGERGCTSNLHKRGIMKVSAGSRCSKKLIIFRLGIKIAVV